MKDKYLKMRLEALEKHRAHIGRRFGNLVLKDVVNVEGVRGAHYLCECDCGGVVIRVSSVLLSGRISKCSTCGRKDFDAQTYRTRHGMSKTSTYRIWDNMRRRCLDPKDKSYGRYGGKGITVCERWNIFDNFLADMGVRPKGLEIDRIDSKGPYSPENCRWTTREENLKNRTFK